jgi:hypothetical protein
VILNDIGQQVGDGDIVGDIKRMGLRKATLRPDGVSRLFRRSLITIDNDHPGTFTPHDHRAALPDT